MELPETNNLYVACIDLSGRDCLVVGGGAMAREKIEGLLSAGARVTVVAEHADGPIRDLAVDGRVRLVERGFHVDDVSDVWVVIACSENPAVDRAVAAAAEARGKLVNVADLPELCNFILPAIVRDGPIAVAISTAGASPALAQRIKREVRSILDRPFGELAARLRALRPWARSELATYAERRDFFRAIVDGEPDPLDALEAGRFGDVERRIEALKNAAARDS